MTYRPPSDELTRRILECVTADDYKPQSPSKLARELGIGPDDIESFDEALSQLRADRQITFTATGKIRLPKADRRVVGKVRVSPKGFGVVTSDDKENPAEIFVEASDLAGAITGDTVACVNIHKAFHLGREMLEGRVEEILERGKSRFVGELGQFRGRWAIVVDGRHFNGPIYTPDAASKNAKKGDKCVVEMTVYPEPGREPEGVIVEVLGKSGEPWVETQAVIRQHGIPTEWPEVVLDQVRQTAAAFDPQAERARRTDLTEHTIITIDPDDAKDFDDAISLDAHDDGTVTLGVHIADVSYFVPEGSPLDLEARTRGNSVYFPRHVIPMLPEILSNGLCSLQPGVPRLCKSAFITYDENARPIRARFDNTVILSTQRLTYREAQALINELTGVTAGRQGGGPSPTGTPPEALEPGDEVEDDSERPGVDHERGFLGLDWEQGLGRTGSEESAAGGARRTARAALRKRREANERRKLDVHALDEAAARTTPTVVSNGQGKNRSALSPQASTLPPLPPPPEVTPAVRDLLTRMDQLARRIQKRRIRDGMVTLHMPEIDLVLNENGEVSDVAQADTSYTHTIIEMFMVEANEAASRAMDEIGVPALRRIHPEPSDYKQSDLMHLLGVLGHKVTKPLDRIDLQRLIQGVQGKPESFAINIAVLRSMMTAEYSPEPVGHYALASESYVHFTSPIRRYPDLHIHRLLDDLISGRLRDPQIRAARKNAYSDLLALGQHCSSTERRAEQAERELTMVKVLQVLEKHVGEQIEGVVVGVSNTGVFVQSARWLIDGLVKLEQMPNDYWEVPKKGGIAIARRLGVQVRVGDRAIVQIIGVDVSQRLLDLKWIKSLTPQSGRGLPEEFAARRAKAAKRAGVAKRGSRSASKGAKKVSRRKRK